MKCIEAEDETPSSSKETFYQLSCFIEKGKAEVNKHNSYLWQIRYNPKHTQTDTHVGSFLLG